jgi:hypothetical protein
MSDVDYIHKKCSKCQLFLVVSNFGKNKSKRDGFSTECKACTKLINAKSYADNLEFRRAAMKADYLAKSEEYKARARKWEKENPLRKKELRAGYRAGNREKIKEFSKRDWQKHNAKRLAKKKQYRQENPGIGAAHVRARQTRKQRAMPIWANTDKISRIYKACAAVTRVTGVMHHVDHFYPLKSDFVCGLHNEFNLRIITASDNLSKSNNLPE